MPEKKHLLYLLSLLLSGCTVTIPNIKLCSTAALMSAGADCSETLTDTTSELTLDQWLEFLEPQLEKIDVNGVVTPARGSAMCMSSDDFSKLKTAMEQLCRKVGSACSPEQKKTISDVGNRVERLQFKVMSKKRKKNGPK